jgi:hypothetical protein
MASPEEIQLMMERLRREGRVGGMLADVSRVPPAAPPPPPRVGNFSEHGIDNPYDTFPQLWNEGIAPNIPTAFETWDDAGSAWKRLVGAEPPGTNPPTDEQPASVGSPSKTFHGLTMGAAFPQSGMPDYNPLNPQRTFNPSDLESAGSTPPPVVKNPFRQILLPGGRTLHTNIPEGGSSTNPPISAQDAATYRGYRDADRQTLAAEDARISAGGSSPSLPPEESWKLGTSFEGPKFSPIRMDPASESTLALVRSAARFTAERDKAKQPVSGTVSMIEGTKEQQDQRLFEDTIRASALANAQNELKYAQMGPLDPGLAAIYANKPLMLAQWYADNALRTLKGVNIKIAAYSTPGQPGYIADPTMRAAEIAKLQAEKDKALEIWQTAAAAGKPASPFEYAGAGALPPTIPGQ